MTTLWPTRRSMAMLLLILVLFWCTLILVRNGIAVDPMNRTHSSKRSVPTIQFWIPNEPDMNLSEALQRVIPLDAINSTEMYNPFRTCRPTNQVRLIIPEDSNSTQHWVLQAFHSNGTRKTNGGDEFYVTYHDTDIAHVPTGVALIVDRSDGTYELDFVSPPDGVLKETRFMMGGGRLTVHFLYTCGLGGAFAPMKDTWPTGGSSPRVSHQVHLRHPITNDTVPSPVIRPFQRPPNQHVLNSFDVRVAVGDSVMGQMMSGANFVYKTNIWSMLASTTLGHWVNTIEEWHGDQLRNESSSVALILGSATWDVVFGDTLQGDSFEDHLASIRNLTQTLHARYPNVILFWKLPPALHIHVAGIDCWGSNEDCAGRLRYISRQRNMYLYQMQSALMRELNIATLDVHGASYLSAHLHLGGDAIHYIDEFNEFVKSFFYSPAN